MNLKIETIKGLFCGLIFLLSFQIYGQEKFKTDGRVNLNLGFGFGINNLSNNQAGDKDGAALTGTFKLGADYGFTKLISGGIVLFRNGFATNKDSSERASIAGFGIYGNLNFYRGKSTVWFWQLGFGGSQFTYENFKSNGKLTASGAYIVTGLGFRKYFGDHVGFFSNLNLAGYNYNQFKLSDGQIFKTPSGNDFQLGLTSVEFNIGIVVALGKNED